MRRISLKLVLSISCVFFAYVSTYAINVSDALRNGNDASKNIYSKNTIIAREQATVIEEEKEDEEKVTVIKHKLAINHLDDVNYVIVNDEKVDRLMIKMFLDTCILYAKDGFYQLNNRLYYFDSDGHMVLGPCVDKEGNQYFFSYETGELLEG